MTETGLYEAMSTLRAVRRLRPDPIPDAVLRRVLEASTWAPTGGNVQPWRVVVVSEAEAKGRLGELYAEQWRRYVTALEPRLAALADEERAKAKRVLAAGDYLADHFYETPVLLVFCFHPQHMAITDAGLDRPSVVGGGSVYPAVQNALLAARAEGLGCVLTTLLCFDEAEVKTMLGIPDGWGTAAVVPLGYPVGGGHGPISRRPVEAMAFSERWDEPIVLDDESV